MDWAIELAAATGTVAEVSLEVDGVEDGSPTDEDSGNVDVLDAGVTSTDASAETATEAGAFATRWTEGTPAKRSVWAPFMNPISWLSTHQPHIGMIPLQQTHRMVDHTVLGSCCFPYFVSHSRGE